MNTVYFIVSWIISLSNSAATLQQPSGAAIVELYNQKLNFFESFVSPNGINNLLQSKENVPSKAVDNLRQAWVPYTNLCGEMIKWCTEVKNTVDLIGQNRESESQLVSNVLNELRQMKYYLDTIEEVEIQVIKNYEAQITFQDGILKYEVNRGFTPTNIKELLAPLLEKSISEGTVLINTTMTTFNDKLQYAKRMITETQSAITNVETDDFNKEYILTKCGPILEKLNNKVSPISTTPMIAPSMNDSLEFYSSECNWYPECCQQECRASLSKATMDHLRKLYRIDESVTGLLNAINNSVSPECKSRLHLFIKNSFISWAYKVDIMRAEQFMRLSVCLNSEKLLKVSIVD